MASNPLVWPDGFGGTAGDDPLATAKNIYVYADASTHVRFVHSGTGDNANAGTRQSPWKSLHYAMGQVGSGDVIVVMAGHAEKFTTNRTVAARIIIIGEGTGNNRPTITPAVPDSGGSGVPAITLNAPCHIRGLRFVESDITRQGADINASAAGAIGTRVAYCEFVSGKHDQGTKLMLNTGGSVVDRCTFKSTATEYADRPERALSNARLVRNSTFDGGAYGWKSSQVFQNGWGNTATGPVVISGTGNTVAIQCVMTNGAHFDVTATPDYSIHPFGAGLVGHPLISGAGLFVNQDIIFYVSSLTGTNASGYGYSPQRPFATLKYAIATASASGLIVCLEGHSEYVTGGPIALSNPTLVVGAGTGDNRPKFIRDANINLFTLNSSNGVGLINVVIPASTTSATASKILVAVTGALVDQCEIVGGALDPAPQLYIDTDGDEAVVSNSTFRAAGTSASPPGNGLRSHISDNLLIDNCVFDGNEFGFVDGVGAQISAVEVFAENISLLRGATMVLDPQSYAFTIDAFVQVQLATGGGGVSSRVMP